MQKILVFVILILSSLGVFAQTAVVLPLNEKIEIDGILNENVWQVNPANGQFIQNFPYDTCASNAKTEFWITADEDHLYAAFKCYNTGAKKGYTVQSLQRDFSVNSNDAIVLTLGPFLDGQNGFSFGVTPQNAQREGSVENAGNFGVSTAWDQVWFSETHITPEYWTAEFKIPLNSIRYNSQNAQWKMNVSRIDYNNNEKSCWKRVPRNFNISALMYCGDLNWTNKPKPQKGNLTLIPYISGTGNQNIVKNESFETKPKVGIDAKISLSSSLNLDLTINPDFAQVDVDVQQINLTQFNLFFPERRQFFIENSDLFANFGFRGIRPFFSRRVGLNVPITAGGRITGKIGNKWRVGLMNVSTRDQDSTLPAKNYLVAAFQRKIFKASNIGFILSDDRSYTAQGTTVTGLEYNLLSPDNKWVGKVFYQQSFSPEAFQRAFAHASFLAFRNIHWSVQWNHEFSGSGFRAPTGFVPRQRFENQKTRQVTIREFWRLEPSVAYTIYPKSKYLNNTKFLVYHSSYYDSAYKPTEGLNQFGIENIFQNSAQINLNILRRNNNIFLPFNPISGSDTNFLLGQYGYNLATLDLISNQRKKLNGVLNLSTGQFYNGTKNGFTLSGAYRMQPWGVFSLSYQREQIDLPVLGNRNLDLLGLKAEVSFTTTMYLNSFLQYNTQAKNTNLYIRYQWRYRPMSDLFLVYSENYDLGWQTKNRNLAFKFVYWLNT